MMTSPIKCTLFQNAWDARSEIDLTIEQVAQIIHSDVYQQVQGNLREIIAAEGRDSPRYKSEKLHLAAPTLAGTFRGGKFNTNLNEYSGVVHVDLDDLTPSQVAEYQTRLRTDPHVLLSFVSPSGLGLKICCVHEGDVTEHEAVFWAWRDYVLRLLNCPESHSDDSVRNLARLCFLAHDPNAHYNLSAKPFTSLGQGAKLLFDAAAHAIKTSPKYEDDDPVALCGELLEYVAGFDDYKQWVDIGLAVKEWIGTSGFNLWDKWSSQSAKYDAGSIYKKWERLAPDGRMSGRAKLLTLAKEAGWTPKKDGLGEKPRNTGAKPQESGVGKDSEPASEAQPEAPKNGFGFIEANEFLSDLSPPAFLISGMLEADSLVSLVGQPGSGKSFLALDWACCIATGRAWMDRNTKQGTVFYLAGEGRYGLKRRLMTWMDHNGPIPPDRLHFSNQAIALTETAYIQKTYEAIDEIAQRTGAEPSLIIVDTLARHFGAADENSTQGMSLFVSMLDSLRAQWGCTVMIVHHTGKDASKGARGNSALMGALDASFLVEMDEEKRICLSNQKMKDGETPPAQHMTLLSQRVVLPNGHELLHDDGVTPVTSCILIPTDPPDGGQPPKKPTSSAKEDAAIKAYFELLAKVTEEVERLGLDQQHLRVCVSEWAALCKSDKYRLSRHNVSDIKTNKRNLFSTFHSLVRIEDDYFYSTE